MLRFLGIGNPSKDHESEPASLAEISSQLDTLPAEEARFVSAFSYLLARVASVDLSTAGVERDAMRRRLEGFVGMDPTRAALLSEAAIRAAETYSASDGHLVARAFRDMSGEAERLRLLRCLYAVAAADETISTVEDNDIFEVARAIGVRQPDVVAVRSEFKQYLGSMKSLRTED